MRQSCQQRARCSLPDYAERSASFSYASAASDRPRGINGLSALCPLCRYRHKSHWTGHPARLSRNLEGRFGSEGYAREELVAEMTSAFVCAQLHIQPTVRHTDYIGNWLTVLRGDARAIFQAASMASRAADFLLTSTDQASRAA